MGIDIQLVIEYADLKDNTVSVEDLEFIEFAEVTLGRNSNFFSLLAGVKGNHDPVIPLRGLPANASDSTKALCLIRVFPEAPSLPENFTNATPGDSYAIVEGHSNLEVFAKDPKAADLNLTPYNEDTNLFYDPNFHSHSWLVLSELKEVYAKVLKDNIYDNSNPAAKRAYGSEAVLRTMEILEKEDNVLTRVVFWFNG